MLDDMLDYLEHIRERPVWQPIPQPVRDMFHESLPIQPTDLATAHASFMRDVLPYAVGNAHGCMAAARQWACWQRCWRLG